MFSSLNGCKRICVSMALALAIGAIQPMHAQIDVVTWHNDLYRSGVTTAEAILTPSNVNSKTFGLLANVVVDGKVDAQPLYISAQSIPGKGIHNVLYIATEHDSVYAVDADSGTVLWMKSLLGAGETTSDTHNCFQITPEIGITATPVIDVKAGPHGVLYVVALTKNASGIYIDRVHALDLSTAAELFNGPVVVAATYPGTGDGSSNGVSRFDSRQYKNRAGLLLQNNTIYTTWSSHCDRRPYTGWMIAYNEYTLAQTAVLSFAPNGNDAAPWNAGAAPAADSDGNIFVALGNGTFDDTLNAQGMPSLGDYGNAVVKLSTDGGGLKPVDYWTMDNTDSESAMDADLGSGGLMMLPDLVDSNNKTRHLAVVGGKDHNIYVIDRDNLGHFDSAANATVYQYVPGALPGGSWASPVYFNSRLYYGSVGQNLRSFEVSQAKLMASPIQTTSTVFEYPGTTPSISAYNSNHAIVWASESSTPAVLHAYDANNLSDELYNSGQAPNGRDQFGAGNKFIVPTIANGKVYVGTENSVGIFGLLHLTPAPLPDGVYTMSSAQSHLLLNSPSASSAVAITAGTANGQLSQEWFFSYGGSGYYTIQNVSTRRFLSNDTGASTASSSAVHQGVPSYNASEFWSLTPSGSGYVLKNIATGLVIDAGKALAGQNVTLDAANGGATQVWAIQ